MDSTHAFPVQAAPVVRLEECLVYRNRFVALYDDRVRFMNGRPGRYYRVVPAGSSDPPVVVMPVAAGCAALVRVWRYAVQSWEWGFPRGYAHGPDSRQSARAELAEEIGAEPEELVPLGRIWPDSAHTESTVHAYAARLSPEARSGQAADTEEIAEIRWLPLPELAARIAAGQITDGFTLAAFGLWSACRAAQ
jgi:8-oxo-dGTP pyrophosphatase MutT (NUDIX family)